MVKQIQLTVRTYMRFVALACLFGALASGQVAYGQSASPNFSLSEAFIGSGGELDAGSPSFQAKSSIGDLGVGNSASAAFQAFAGFTTTDQPYLEFFVDDIDINLGDLSTSTTAFGTANFYVRSYLTSGYVVTLASPGFQSENANFIDNLAANSTSTPGTEQFGVNVVANTSPVAGANPVQIPDASFSFGQAAANYDTPNSFRYVQGETIAQSDRSTGQTNYRATYIVNIGSSTEAGVYSSTQTYVATAQF